MAQLVPDTASTDSFLTWRTNTNLLAANSIKNKLDATSNPSVTNDDSEGYVINSVWVNVSADTAYILLDNTTGAAVWKLITAQTALTPDHNDTGNIQGGTTDEYYHLSAGQLASLGLLVSKTGDIMTGELELPNAILSDINESIVSTAIDVAIYNIEDDDDLGVLAVAAGLSKQYVLITEATQILIYSTFPTSWTLDHTITGLTDITCMEIVNGQIMVGTLTGLHIYDMRNSYTAGTPPAITNNVIREISGKPDGSMGITWAIANDDGLSIIQPNNSVAEQETGTAQTHVYLDYGVKSSTAAGIVNIWDTAPTTSTVSPDKTETVTNGTINTINSNRIGSTDGMVVLNPNLLSGIQNQRITKDFISGFVPNNTEGSWLCDSSTGAVGATVPDTSVYNKTALTLVGALTKTAITPNLVEYDGFSVGNYLTQSYNSSLDFGTGDFHIMVWVNGDITDDSILYRGDTTGSLFNNKPQFLLYDSSSTDRSVKFRVGGDDTTFDVVESTELIPVSGWTLVSAWRDGGSIYISVNDTTPVSSAATIYNLTNATAEFIVGAYYYTTIQAHLNNASLSLLRIGTGALSAAIVKEIYDTELPMLSETRSKLLEGSSNNIVDIETSSNNTTHIITTTDVCELSGDYPYKTTTEVISSLAIDGDLIVKGS